MRPTEQTSLFDVPRATREDSRAKAAETAAQNRDLIMAAYSKHGRMTADEAGAKVGFGPLEARPRVSELHKAGRLKPVGRGKSALGNSAAIYEAVE